MQDIEIVYLAQDFIWLFIFLEKSIGTWSFCCWTKTNSNSAAK